MKIFLNLLTISLLSGSCFGSALIDQKAPDFSLFDSYGKEISLNSFEGKKVVIEWTNHGCPFVAKHYKTGNMQSTQEFTIENDAIWLSVISSAPGTQGFVSSDEANELTAFKRSFTESCFI
jgi:hypothetical protein